MSWLFTERKGIPQWLVKNLPANVKDIRDMGSIPESRRSSIIAQKIPWTRGALWANKWKMPAFFILEKTTWVHIKGNREALKSLLETILKEGMLHTP